MKKRKFRCMTIYERCNTIFNPCDDCEYRDGIFCKFPDLSDENKPFKTSDGKYVLIEVKE